MYPFITPSNPISSAKCPIERNNPDLPPPHPSFYRSLIFPHPHLIPLRLQHPKPQILLHLWHQYLHWADPHHRYWVREMALIEVRGLDGAAGREFTTVWGCWVEGYRCEESVLEPQWAEVCLPWMIATVAGETREAKGMEWRLCTESWVVGNFVAHRNVLSLSFHNLKSYSYRNCFQWYLYFWIFNRSFHLPCFRTKIWILLSQRRVLYVEGFLKESSKFYESQTETEIFMTCNKTLGVEWQERRKLTSPLPCTSQKVAWPLVQMMGDWELLGSDLTLDWAYLLEIVYG